MKKAVTDFVQRGKNAVAAIEQLRRGEWEAVYNYYSDEHLTAYRKGLKLWIGNGPFFCEIGLDFDDPHYFGLFWRHFVWWFGARKLKRTADRARIAPRLEVPKL